MMLTAPLSNNARRSKVATGYSFPAPVGGWDAVSPLAAMKPDRAILMDNWFPQPGYVEVRRGFTSFASGMGSGVVESLMPYSGTTTSASKLYAAANNNIYEISTGTPSADVTSLTNNRWQHVNFTTSAAKFLWICNGADAPRHYNGSAWATPSLTITTFSSSDIIHVNAHKRRLWVVFKNSTVAGYLPTESVAGVVTNFDLGPFFTRGGYLVAMATWTIDGGDGVDDKAVFISSEGQAAVYVGTDPSSSNTWQLEGVYNLGPPIGRRCFIQSAGDLAIINDDGVLPLSRALGVDRAAAPQVAITARINRAMSDAARSYRSNFGWEMITYTAGTMLLLNVPVVEGTTQHQYAMNTLTGAWSRFTGQNANCWAVFKNNLYFGGNSGAVFKADTGGKDNSETISAILQTAYSDFGTTGRLKKFGMAQPIVTTASDGKPSIGISTDYKDNAVVGTPTSVTTGFSVYDTAKYDSTDIYASDSSVTAEWTNLSGYGQVASLHVRASKSSTEDSVIRLNSINVTYETGAFM